MKVVNRETCRPYVDSPGSNDTGVSNFTMDEGMICAGGVVNESVCQVITCHLLPSVANCCILVLTYKISQGDSGGPLTYKAGDQHVLIGVTSFGDGCGGEGVYGVFARVSHYMGWIDKHIKQQAKYCKSGRNAQRIIRPEPGIQTTKNYPKSSAPTTIYPDTSKIPNTPGTLTTKIYQKSDAPTRIYPVTPRIPDTPGIVTTKNYQKSVAPTTHHPNTHRIPEGALTRAPIKVRKNGLEFYRHGGGGRYFIF